ncbi:MAG: hypothetical protein QOJ64_2903 [Acidobacteriota bacterium]|nr:hypothetical protein [Acidobacteriota bacterium]
MSVFAAIWWVVGLRVSGYTWPLSYGVPLVVGGLIVAVALRSPARFEKVSPEEHARRGRLVGIASGAEGVAILLAVNVLARMGQSDYAAPVIAIVVGLHFVPLAHLLPARLYYATAAFLVLLGICGFAIRDRDLRLFMVGVAAACILWLTSVAVLGRKRIPL